MKCLVLIAAVTLSGCTAQQAFSNLNEAGEAAKKYVQEHVQTRSEYRANIKETVLAEYRSLMRGADLAERNGDIILAREYWAAARILMTEEMPDLKQVKEKVKEFFEE